MSRAPVHTITQLDALDETEIIEGYRDGLDGEQEPGNNRSDSYWHGWKNGAADRGYRKADRYQTQLVKEIIAKQRAIK